MNIPQIDQDLATIKAAHVQHVNGYHLSDSDYEQLLDAIIRVQKLKREIQKSRAKTQ